MKLVTIRYLNNSTKNFLHVKKTSSISPTWKHILDHRKFFIKGLLWILRNGESINFWYDFCVIFSYYSAQITITETNLNHLAKVSEFISPSKTWNLNDLNGVLSNHIIDDVRNIAAPVSNIDDKMIWKFSTDSNFSIKTVTWANNGSIDPHPKAKFQNNIWNLKLTSKLKFFTRKLLGKLFLLRQV